MSYVSGLKGLLTEKNPADAGESTLQESQDMVISQDSKLESRHGVNVQKIEGLVTYSVTNSNISIFKIPFSSTFATSSGYLSKYVILTGATNLMQELATPNTFSNLTILNDSPFLPTSVAKPIGFTFDQSFYIVGSTGWQEMKLDTLASGTTGVKKVINWPPFSDISIETFQDTLDFSANWLDINKKVGIRVSYVWNTRYNDETAREVESGPSQIFEMLHPMALRTQVSGSSVAATIKDKSRIRLRIGESFTSSIDPFFEFHAGENNGRKFFIRIYRTKQVGISEALPTEYFTAFPDIDVGGTAKYSFANDSLVSSASDTIDFGTQSGDWKNGSLFRYAALSNLIGGLTSGSLYYLGNKVGTTYQVYMNNLLTSPINLTAPIGNTAQHIIRAYEANLTVNDDGIQTLPQLYTNPNLDGEANRNALPPIAESVVEYKNYHVVANVRDPLRAYVTLVSQPLIKQLSFNTSHTIAAPTTVTSLTALAASDLTGITAGDFKLDTPFWGASFPTITAISSASLTLTASDAIFSATAGYPSTFSVITAGTAYQNNAQINFRFNGIAPIVVSTLLPKYNRGSLYSRSDDKNLDYLQYSGNAPVPLYDNSPVGWANGTTRGTVTQIGTISVANSVAPLANGDYTIPLGTNKLDASSLKEPGILVAVNDANSVSFMITYKTFELGGTNTITFKNCTFITGSSIGPSSGSWYFYALSGSTVSTLPIYHYIPPGVVTGVVFNDGSPVLTRTVPLYSLLPVTGYYNKPIGTLNQLLTVSTLGKNILFFGNLSLSPAQLLDACVIDLVQKLNTANINNAIKFVKTNNVGEFYVEYYGGTSIEARITGDYHAYEPEIVRSATNYTMLAKYDKNNVRALSVSRYNAPESFPDAQVLGPALIGSDKKKIVALAKNTNDCFILKEDGIWRMTIAGNTSLPFIEEITQMDTTTFIQAKYSVQEINEEIIFLSQKGFISVSGNSIENIGRGIETEVKAKLQRSIAAGLQTQIRSWVNEEKRIYGCTIQESTVAFTTYIFNTYTREWTKFSLPVLDATTDEQGRTTYAVGLYTRTLDASGTLQAQLDNSSTGALINYFFTEEIHTDGQNRAEGDQWDYWYKPASAAIVGDNVVFTDTPGLAPWSRLGGATTNITISGLPHFVGKTPYYRKDGVLYKAVFVSRTTTTVTVAFPGGIPAGIAAVGATDGLYAGVSALARFNPTQVGTPDTNKQFSEYMIHTEEAVSALKMRFKTDSQAAFSATREFAFNASATNRTVYRTFIPLTAGRGRWFIREVSHDVPFERLVMTSQTINVRDTGNTRIQKSPR